MRRALDIAALIVTGLLLWIVSMVAGVEGSELGLPTWLTGPLAAVLALGAGGLGLVIHGLLDRRLFGARGEVDSVADLVARDLLLSTTYRAGRACQIREFDDEGSHYVLALDNGALLYLTGQFLYEYEALEDDEEAPIPRRFPCTEFTVHFHRTRGYVAAIDCRGKLIEPDPVLDCDRLETIRERLGVGPEEWPEVTLRRDLSFDDLIRP